MKRSHSFLILSLFFCFTCHSQDNKPEANSFGLQYGVNFNGTVGQAVQFSGWLKNGVEIRGSLSFSYSSSQSTTVSVSQDIGWTGSYYVPGVITSTSSSASLAVTPALSLVKHFRIIGNLDFFVGGAVSYGVSVPTAWSRNASTSIGDSVYSYSSTNIKNPATLTWGISATGGANYFFYKNLAIGADFGVGLSASNMNGTFQEQEVEINTGSYNESAPRNNSNLSISNKVTSNKYTASLTGNAGLHLTYYLKIKKRNSVVTGTPKL